MSSSGVFRLFYVLLLLFILLTVAVVVAHGPIIEYFNRAENFTDTPSTAFEDMVATDDIELRTVATELVSACAADDVECKVYKIYRHAVTLPATELPPYEGAPDIYRRPLYFSSLLANAEIPSKLVQGEDILLNAVCGLSETVLYNIALQDMRRNGIINDSVRLAAEKVWFSAPELPEDGAVVDIDIISSEDINVYVFNSLSSMDPSDSTAYFPECSGITGKNIQERCFLYAGNVIAVYSGAQGAAYHINVSDASFTQDDILTAAYDGQHCIVLDVAADGAPLKSSQTDGTENIINIR